jgi:hypothetical protein
VAFSYSFIFLEILYFLGRNREERHNEGREGGMGGGREKRKIPVSDGHLFVPPFCPSQSFHCL